MSAEYIMASGNEHVILCERGIRTFDDYTRNTLDLVGRADAARAVASAGRSSTRATPPASAVWCRPMALAATACGADGLMIEVHNDPLHALCDGAQSLTCEQFAEVAASVRAVRKAVAK